LLIEFGHCTVLNAGVASIAKDARPGRHAERNARLKGAERLLRMPPEHAGEIIVRGVERDSPRIMVGTDAKVISLLERLMPVRCGPVLTFLMSRR
jgi:hypothetical protein